MLRCVGPGLIVAGSIVGSGELIATTKTGAEAGMSLLWLILLGCVIKVFTQIELGRYTLISGKTTLAALDLVPGPRIAGRGNWLVWFWIVMWVASISQLGGIVGGVGQALAISVPLTSAGRDHNDHADRQQRAAFEAATQAILAEQADAALEASVITEPAAPPKKSYDAVLWAAVMAVVTSLMLMVGRYGLIQSLSTALVILFTLLTVLNTIWLQSDPFWGIPWPEVAAGLWPQLPDVAAADTATNARPIATALATFGIIGVGAAELVVYPYWCLEKGYARFTGPDDGSPSWAARASGWMRVMHLDSWGAMVLYTFATVAFYLLGAGVLHRIGLNPEKDTLVRTLSVMYQPVFGSAAAVIFLAGAFAVLYSTFFVALAAHARVFSDAMRIVGLIDSDEATRAKWIRWLGGFFPILCWIIYVAFPAPAQLVLISGVAQGVMLPMLAGAALYFRYQFVSEPLRPGRLWDAMLWISAAAMLVTGAWTVVSQF
ncbi:Natural resistance-associated macrophage protein [Allorhodopirellula solitaria]|uniref:Natural resistance-associated macrophage protein n=2 Tax=Allorhodopirellula solitaria TaxID=2527987 RepID=A0A5C5XSK5_9BACT|nr:Natural resistance-associated macrophage protein [Allorhodopirellula solitaria]